MLYVKYRQRPGRWQHVASSIHRSTTHTQTLTRTQTHAIWSK